MKFSIRELFLVTAIVALALGMMGGPSETIAGDRAAQGTTRPDSLSIRPWLVVVVIAHVSGSRPHPA